MKKNFLKVAALLIAAMLMVVSCTQEVAPVNNGLVDASLNVAYGRDLSISGAAKNDDLKLRYTMTPGWIDDSNDTDTIVGGKTNEELKPDGKLGWVTPGYWTITVNAFEGEDTSNPIFSGTSSIYFTSKNNVATIYLEPAGEADYSIEFDFKMQDLGETYGEDYVVKYTIAKNGTALTNHSDVAFVKSGDNTNEVTLVSGTDRQSSYQKTVSGLAAGYYTVTVSVYEVKDVVKNDNGEITSKKETLKGGISKGMLLAGTMATSEGVPSKTVVVGGHIEPSDYIATNVTTYFVDVNTTLACTTSYDTASNKATVTCKLTDNTAVNSKLSNITRTYLWTVDGTSYTQISNPTLDSNKVATTRTQDYTVPGYKSISCRTIYSYTDIKDTEDKTDDVTYFWADTQTERVYIDATKITY